MSFRPVSRPRLSPGRQLLAAALTAYLVALSALGITVSVLAALGVL